MITEAQKQFDEEYKIIRRLLISRRINLSPGKIKKWIRAKGIRAIDLGNKELQGEKIVRNLKRQSRYEQELLKEISEEE